MSSCTYSDHLQVIKGFCEKADGKDKLTGLIQYVCMFLSANEPGNIKKIQASVTAARKVFRIMRPLESLTPLLISPGFNNKEPKMVQAVNKLKALLMATYFGADHFAWAYQIGLIQDKQTGETAGKVSLWSWGLGSVAGIIAETIAISHMKVTPNEGESQSDYIKREAAIRGEINAKLFLILHAVVQAAVAAGLLQLLPLKPRTTGLLGAIASGMNCYLLLPKYPKLAVTAEKSKAQ
mmetsp:Transcript_16710/g.28681  ORF Transcript_16710/g.28681 Transcript_16710/m.28681 type:complete len:237 (+) Transcript_16710:118-828(+)